jgi:hypothetical protein
MPSEERKAPTRCLYVLLAVGALAHTGCLLAVASLAAGAGATGYCYCKGRMYRDFGAPLPVVHAAARAALLDLHFVLFTEDAKDGKVFLVTRTANGKKVRIYLDALSSPIPSEGVLTRVAIRVATFGDEGISARIFEQIDFRLKQPAPVVPPTPLPPTPTPVQQTGFQTSEPRIAPTPQPKEAPKN